MQTLLLENINKIKNGSKLYALFMVSFLFIMYILHIRKEELDSFLAKKF